MKKIITNKWFGLVVVSVFSLIIALFVASQIKPMFQDVSDGFLKESGEFLPITLKNGEIVSPANTEIRKTYKADKDEVLVVLDTRVDEFTASSLTQEGLYVSKKCVYAVSDKKVETRCFKDTLNTDEEFVLTQEMVEKGMKYINKYIGIFLGFVAFIGIFIFCYAAIAIYTCLMHWMIAWWFKKPFSQTFFTNTWMYILIQCVALGLALTFGFWATFVLLLATNVVICAKNKG